MSRRAPTAGRMTPYIERQLGDKYEVVQSVKDNMEMLQRLANIDLELLMSQLSGQHFQDVTAVTVAADQPARWDPVTKILEIPAGQPGEDGKKGEPGEQDRFHAPAMIMLISSLMLPCSLDVIK